MIITSDNIWSYVTSATPDEHSYIHDLLKYREDGYRHTYLFKSGRWDGHKSLYNMTRKRFRRGLLDRVASDLPSAGMNVTTVNNQPVNTHVAKHAMIPGVIRPYEFQARVADIVGSKDTGLIVSPTGTGKTVLLAIAANSLGKHTIILVTDLVLLDQMHQAMSQYFTNKIGFIGDGVFELGDITVSTIQSILSIMKRGDDRAAVLMEHLKKVDVVMSDESHISDTESFSELMPYFESSSRFYGFSATPYGYSDTSELKENILLEQHFGTIIYDTRNLDFIGMGLKVPIFVQVHDLDPVNAKYTTHMKKERGKMVLDHTKNYAEALKTEIVENPAYHQLVADKAIELANDGNIVFVHAAHSLEFGQKITDLIPGAVFVNGKTPRELRRKIYDSARAGIQKVIVSDIGGTGLNIPNLNAIVLASAIKDVRQLAGRVTRTSPGKDCGIIVDFNIKTTFLKKHHEVRMNQYAQERFMIMHF
jgi:superfamily II DNA or RNA helicase